MLRGDPERSLLLPPAPTLLPVLALRALEADVCRTSVPLALDLPHAGGGHAVAGVASGARVAGGTLRSASSDGDAPVAE